MNRLHSLFIRYQNELRPLIIDYESRKEEFLESILYGVPVMFDNAARAVQENDRHLLAEAERNLDEMLQDVRLEVLASYIDSDNEYRNRYGEDVINAIDGGVFSREYNRMRCEAQAAVDCGNLTKAIDLFGAIEKLRDEHHPTAIAIGNLRQSVAGFFTELIVSVIISIAVGVLIARLL